MSDRTITQENYRFNEKEHCHQLLVNGNWKNLTGVSESIKFISNFGVAAYYGSRRALMALGYDPKEDKKNVEGFRDFIVGITDDDDKLSEVLYKAYTAHATYAKERADKGTNSHDILSKYIQKCIDENDGLPMDTEEPVVKKFLEMTAKWKPKFIATEKHGFNEDLFIGGICDLIVETNEGMGVWDFKDRAYATEKDLIQTGGYAHLFPLEFTHGMVIPLEGKEVAFWGNMGELKRLYECALQIHRFQNK